MYWKLFFLNYILWHLILKQFQYNYYRCLKYIPFKIEKRYKKMKLSAAIAFSIWLKLSCVHYSHGSTVNGVEFSFHLLWKTVSSSDTSQSTMSFVLPVGATSFLEIVYFFCTVQCKNHTWGQTHHCWNDVSLKIHCHNESSFSHSVLNKSFKTIVPWKLRNFPTWLLPWQPQFQRQLCISSMRICPFWSDFKFKLWN